MATPNSTPESDSRSLEVYDNVREKAECYHSHPEDLGAFLECGAQWPSLDTYINDNVPGVQDTENLSTLESAKCMFWNDAVESVMFQEPEAMMLPTIAAPLITMGDHTEPDSIIDEGSYIHPMSPHNYNQLLDDGSMNNLRLTGDQNEYNQDLFQTLQQTSILNSEQQGIIMMFSSRQTNYDGEMSLKLDAPTTTGAIANAAYGILAPSSNDPTSFVLPIHQPCVVDTQFMDNHDMCACGHQQLTWISHTQEATEVQSEASRDMALTPNISLRFILLNKKLENQIDRSQKQSLRAGSTHALNRLEEDSSSLLNSQSVCTVGQPSSYICTASGCKRSFQRQSDLRKHQSVHVSKNDRRYGCATCGERFYYVKDLKRHLRSRTHGDPSQMEQPQIHLCPVHGCERQKRGFSRHDKLMDHLSQKHSGRELDSKLRSSKNKLFPCDTEGCVGGPFGSQHDLLRHRSSVHNDLRAITSYACVVENCKMKSKIWPRLDNFKQHVKRLHKDEDLDDIITRSKRDTRSDTELAHV